MDQDHARIAGLLGIARPSGTDQPRLTLIPARCAVGISASGAGFRVIHAMSGKYLGVVARVGDGWCFASPSAERLTDTMFHYPNREAAATALSAHILDHKLSVIRDRLAMGMVTLYCDGCDDSVLGRVFHGEDEDYFVCAPAQHYVGRDEEDTQSVWEAAFAAGGAVA